MNAPPYWPYRCGICSRFVSNPVATILAGERIVDERGDCKRCGPDVRLAPGLSWEDWFGWGDAA